jgi:hypothetical protein
MIDTDKNKVLGVLKEVSNAMTRIEAERDFIKEAVKAASEEHEIDKKILRKMAVVYHKQNFDTVQGESEEFLTMYETIVK